jgi:hypothetical protein
MLYPTIASIGFEPEMYLFPWAGHPTVPPYGYPSLDAVYAHLLLDAKLVGIPLGGDFGCKGGLCDRAISLEVQ